MVIGITGPIGSGKSYIGRLFRKKGLPVIDADKVYHSLTNKRSELTDELENERIDIVPYDEDIKKYAANALQPAKVKEVIVNEEKHELLIKVSDEQSRIAFGRKAQNIRLSAKLIGWNITLRNAEEETQEPSLEDKMKQAAEKLAADFNVSVGTADILVKNGFVTIDGIRAADPETLLEIEGIDRDEVSSALGELDK